MGAQTPELVAAVESYSDCEAELREIYPRHWAELNTAGDIPLDPNYDNYRQLDAAGVVLLVTLRHARRLVGYFIGFLFPELHYQTVFACIGDIFYVLPEFRKGRAGTQLFRAVEVELRKRQVDRWHVNSKIHRDCGALLRRLGFSAVEVQYSKRLN